MRAYIKCLSLVLVLVSVLSCISIYSAGAESEFVKPEKFIYGDVDMDGVVTVKDATAIQKWLVGMEYLTGIQMFLADSGNSEVSVKNATAIQKKIAGISVEGSLVGLPVNTSSQDEFSSCIIEDAEFTDNEIVVFPNYNLEYVYEYTLRDFSEFEFESIEKIGSKEIDSICYVLKLKNSGRENVFEAIETLDYRANFDIVHICPNYIWYVE